MLSSTDNIHSLFEPDPEQIRTHLERLFHRARTEYPEGMCEIAWADGRGQVTSANTFPITPEGLNEATQCAVRHNNEHRNVYVGVNPRKPGTAPWGRASALDVEIAFYHFVDADSAESAARVRKAPLPYTWAVTTGRVPNPRPHVYWELEEPVRNLQAWSAQQRALADHFAGDAVIDPPRIMRLAGTVNYPSPKKIERGYRVELVTIRTVYDDAERDPVTSEALFHSYPWTSAGSDRVDPDTGEIHEDEAPRQNRGTESSPNFDDGRRRIDPEECVRNINAGHNLHNNARDLIAHLVGTGHRDWLIVELLERLLKPVSDGGTLGQIPNLIRTARQKWGIPDPEEDWGSYAGAADAAPLLLKPVGILMPSARPPRDWLVPGRMMRRHVTMTTAPPGVGKSTLVIEETVSMASGIDFLGFGIKEPLRVAVINNEETRDEIERRIEATCTYFDIPMDAIADRLFLYSGVDAEKIILARSDKNGNVLPTIHTSRLREIVNDLKLDAVALDPFVQLHYVEESSNEQISRVMVQLRNLGTGDQAAAIHLVHHNRKPAAGNSHQAGDMSSARGASSMGGEAHFFFTLTDMSERDGEQLNVPEHDRINFLRLDDAKRKMTPATGAKWFERHGVMMPYGFIGEEVGVLIPREMEEVESKILPNTATLILQEIDSAWSKGNPYSSAARSVERYVVQMMVRNFQLTRQAAKRLIDDWLKNEMIGTETRDQHLKLRGLKVLKWPG